MPTKIIGAAVAVAAVALAVWFFAFRDDDDSGSTDATDATSPPATAPEVTEAPLDAAGSELEALLASSRDATFHATYQATGPTETEGGTATSYTIELYRSEGRTRQDTITELEGGDYLTVGILADEVATICTKQGTEDWSCSESAQADPTAADGLFGEVVQRLGGVQVTETAETVAGRDARCFSYESADGPGSICLTSEGIPVRVISGETELLLTVLEDTVDDAVFEPPAEPVSS